MRKDFVVTAYVFDGKKVLLVNHRKLEKWLPAGGHIEPRETPDQTVLREVKEETGLDVEIIKEDYPDDDVDVEMLARPDHAQLENIDVEHQHIDFIYACKLRGKSDERGSEEWRWFSKEDLDSTPNVPNNVKYFGKRIIDKMQSAEDGI